MLTVLLAKPYFVMYYSILNLLRVLRLMEYKLIFGYVCYRESLAGAISDEYTKAAERSVEENIVRKVCAADGTVARINSKQLEPRDDR